LDEGKKLTIWQRIESDIQKITGEPFVITQKQSVSGGDINQAYHLASKQGDYFVKLNSSDFAQMFVAEAQGLDVLRQCDVINVPNVVSYGQFEQYSYLVLQHIQMSQRGNIADFAVALANLHLNRREQFGFEQNNFIGRTPQINDWQSDWGRFFTEQRLGYQLSLLEQLHVSPVMIEKGRQLMPKLASYLNRHNPKPALVHGDLWQGNYAFDCASNNRATPVIYDPACYYADCEVDLAMLELFGNPGLEFFEAYHQVNPIDSGYSKRKPIYNLYHLLNHATLFGSSYVTQSQSIIEQLLEQL
jgi:protein-ribulosamine 3-kinase